MDISQKLFQLKFHISFVVAFSLLILSHIYLAPSFVDLLAFFWPLFVSTAMFLAAVVLFGRTSPQAAGEKAGEGILDYVAGQNQPEEVPTAEGNHPVEVQSAEESPESEKNM